MPDVPRRCWLYSAHRQQYIEAVLCWLPAGFGASEPVRGPLLCLSVVVVVVLTSPGILRYWRWDPDFVHRLCLCRVWLKFVLVWPIITGRSKSNRVYNLSWLRLVYYDGIKVSSLVFERRTTLQMCNITAVISLLNILLSELYSLLSGSAIFLIVGMNLVFRLSLCF